MTLSASEKYEVIRLVEESELSVRRTLNELGVSRSSFYRWYKAYRDDGYEGLVARSKSPKQFWNTRSCHLGSWPGISLISTSTLSQSPVFIGY